MAAGTAFMPGKMCRSPVCVIPPSPVWQRVTMQGPHGMLHGCVMLLGHSTSPRPSSRPPAAGMLAFPTHTWHGKAAKLLSPCQGVLVGAGIRATSPGISAGDLDIPGNWAWYWHLAHRPMDRQTQQDKLMR